MDRCENFTGDVFADGRITNEEWLCSLEYQIEHHAKSYIPPILIATGSLGNCMALIVLTRSSVLRWSICYYLCFLSVTNTLVLCIGCGLDWLSYTTDLPIVPNVADSICRLWQFFFNTILYFAPWLVVAMSIDRFLLLYFPIKAQSLATTFMSKVTIIIIAILLIVVSVHAMWTYELTTYRGCSIDPNRIDFQTKVWPMISASIYSYMPTIVIFIFTLLSIIGLFHPSVCPISNPIQKKLTNLTIALATAFLLFSLPQIIINLIMYSNAEWTHSQVMSARLYFAQIICGLISYLNYSITFILYFIFVPLFRQELKNIFRPMTCSSETRANNGKTYKSASSKEAVTVEEGSGTITTVL